MYRFIVPLLGFLAVVTLASVLIGGIVLRSPDTHSNLWGTVRPGYTRTAPVIVGQAVGDVELTLETKLLQERYGSPIDRGRAIFLGRSCATCHGLDARGGPVGPSLAGVSAEKIKRMVRTGPGGMPVFSEKHLADTDLADLTTYLEGLEVARPDSEKIAALQRLIYDPAVPVGQLLRGKSAIRRACGACHAQPGPEDILRAFKTDAQAAGLVADMVPETNLNLEDASDIAHYMLAVLHKADPVNAP